MTNLSFPLTLDYLEKLSQLKKQKRHGLMVSLAADLKSAGRMVRVECDNCGDTMYRSVSQANHCKAHYCSSQCQHKTLLQRFISKIQLTERGCWIWTARARTSFGYGIISINNRPFSAHRVSFVLFVNDIPKGSLICHRCDVPACVNPNHLFTGTPLDNMIDMHKKGRWKANPARGESHHNRKLTDQSVREIRARYATRTISQYQLARQYGVTEEAIQPMLRGKTWRHVV